MLGILFIGLPLLIYVIGALSVRQKDLQQPDDFFVAYRRIGTTAFSSSSIAYAFQVSTIYPFLLWGASHFYLVPVVNTICWGLGILLFYLCFDRYKQFIGADSTLHGFLGDHYGLSVRVVASYLTIIGFLGIAIAETYFGSKVLLSVIEDRNFFYLVVLAALLFVYGYIVYGGQASSIRTDQLQLIVAYIGVFGLMLYFLYLIVINGIDTTGPLATGFFVLLIYIPLILVKRKFQFIKFSEEDSPGNKWINRLLNLIVSILFLLIFASAAIKLLQTGFIFTFQNFLNLDGFGILGLLSLILLPLMWQFVDLTNWQRLLAVKSDRKEDIEGLHRNIRKGLLIYAIESPFTWIIFLFFGLLAVTALPQFTFQDLLIDLPKQLIGAESLLQRFFGYTFIVSVLAIMLSTVDSFIVGIIFTFTYDSYSRTRKILDSDDENAKKTNYRSIVNAGRIFGFVAILIGILSFIILDRYVENGGELFINLLLAFYSAQLSFFPLIFGILFLKKLPSPFWAILSMVVGAGSGISMGIYAVVWSPEFAWHPILLCTTLSSLTYLCGFVIAYPRFLTKSTDR